MAKITKIYHLADIHIRPYQLLEEYTNKLNVFKEKLIEDVGDTPKENIRIVISGDITHNKTTV